MASFRYEWYTINIQYPTGVVECEYKAKNMAGAVRQIKKEIALSNSPENLERPIWEQMPQIIEVDWESLKLDRVGHQR